MEPRVYESLLVELKNLRNELLHSDDNESLRVIRYKFDEANAQAAKSVDLLKGFEQKKILDSVNSLQKHIDLKHELLNTHQFKFEGAPIPKIESVQSKERSITPVKPLLEGGHWEKITLSREKHVLVAGFEESILISHAPSIHIDRGHNSMFELKSDGSIFLNDMTNCIFVLTCHQLRLHNLQNCIIVCSVTNNRVVIEESNKLKFGLSGKNPEIDDFSWPTKEKENTHYTYTTPDDYSWVNGLPDGQLSQDSMMMLSQSLAKI